MPLIVIDVPEEDSDSDDLSDLEAFDVDELEDDMAKAVDVLDRLIIVLGGDPNEDE